MTRDSKESELAIDGDWAVLKNEQTFFLPSDNFKGPAKMVRLN